MFVRLQLTLYLALSASDVQYCTPRFWALMRHREQPSHSYVSAGLTFHKAIMSFDIAMYTILTIHVNLVIGTLSRYIDKRPEFKELVSSLLRFETLGIYQLSERAHGVDSFNIETTAIKTSDGYFIHTPREEAAKYVVLYASINRILNS